MVTSKKQFTIALIIGSVRENRRGIKVARWIDKKLRERGHNVIFLDPKEKPLPFVDLRYKEYNEGTAPKPIQEYHDRFMEADGFFLVSAEYNHGVPPALKNILDHFGKEFAFKPVAIASYSTGGFGGVRGAEQLRLICLELGMTPTPTIFAVSKVGDAFSEDAGPTDEKVAARAEKVLDEFEWYLEALKNQRE